MHAAIRGITPACLPKVGLDTVELPPPNRHLVAVRGINRNRGLIRSISEDVVAVCIYVRLVTDERSVRRDFPRRSLYFSRGAGGLLYFSSGSVKGGRCIGASVCPETLVVESK